MQLAGCAKKNLRADAADVRSGNQLIAYAPCLPLRDSWHPGHLS
jgi:hypothetical protein